MKMRELEQRTGVNREVIRILFRKGLLPDPVRKARNALDYDDSHVRAIGAVRALQQSDRLTLNEIGDAMRGMGVAARSESSTYHRLEELLAMRFGFEESPTVALATLIDKSPNAERDARTFATMGMLTIVETDAGPHLSLSDARLLEIWGRIRTAGFVEEAGFPPENIAFYLDAAERVAEHEARVFFAASGGKISDDQGAAMLHVALPLMLDFFGLLRIKAFMRHIHQISLLAESPTVEPHDVASRPVL
jgi:DNA-binding transcriptional MerR regulator